MWETPKPLPRMRMRPFFVLLILHTWQGVESQYAVYINPVRMTLEPRDSVRRGEYVSVVCEARVSYTSQVTLSHKVTFFKDDQVLDTKETQNITVSYAIKSARVSHSGRYKCRVEAEGEKSDSSEELLTVTGLQTPNLSINRDHVFEGQYVMAMCHARDEHGPSFNFYFYENAKEIKRIKSDNTEVNVQLDFTPGRKNLQCQYAVQLPDNFVRSEMSENVTIDVKALSITPIISVWPETSVVEGDPLELNCSISEGNSNLRVNLFKDDWFIGGTDTVNRKLTARLQDSGIYGCVLMKGNVEKIVTTNVSVTELFSEPVLTMKPPEVFEGVPFSFSCSSKSVTKSRISHKDVTYTFYKDGQSFEVIGMMTAGKSLDGNYSCHAEAKGISKSSKDFVLKAKELVSTPKIEVMDKVVLGKTFRIRCHSERGSLPIHYTLKKGQQWVGNETMSQPSGYAVFSVSIMNEGDIREFSCHAYNDGPREESSKRQLQVIVPPTKVTISLQGTKVVHDESNDIEEGNIEEGNTLKIHCSVQKGTHPITFSWYRFQENQALNTERVYNNSSVFEVERASKEHEGGYYCEATNQSDMTEKSRVFIIQVKMASWKKALFALLCLLVLAVIIGVVWYKVKRGKRKVVTELSVKPSSATPDDSVTVRLTNTTDVYYSHKVDADVGESSVWGRSSSHSGSEQSAEEDSSEVEYTEVMHPQPANATQAPCRKGTDTVYSELQNSCQGAECGIDGQGAVEYVHLNQDEALIVQ